MSLSILLRCLDIEQTKNFYESALGFNCAFTAEQTLTVARDEARLVFTSLDLWDRAPALSGTIYLAVSDVDRYFAAIEGQVSVAWPLETMPYGSREFAITAAAPASASGRTRPIATVRALFLYD